MTVFAYYCNEDESHYLQICREVVRFLASRGHNVSVLTYSVVWPLHLSHASNVAFRQIVAQPDHAEQDSCHSSTSSAWVQKEAAWLESSCVQLVVSSLVPSACSAAAQAGIPSVCIAKAMWGKTTPVLQTQVDRGCTARSTGTAQGWQNIPVDHPLLPQICCTAAPVLQPINPVHAATALAEFGDAHIQAQQKDWRAHQQS